MLWTLASFLCSPTGQAEDHAIYISLCQGWLSAGGADWSIYARLSALDVPVPGLPVPGMPGMPHGPAPVLPVPVAPAPGICAIVLVQVAPQTWLSLISP